MLRGFYHQQWWFDEEFHEGSMMVIPYVYSNHSNIYIYVCVCVLGGEEPPWTQSILVWEGYGGELTHGNSGDSAGCLGYPYSLSALIFRVETSRLDIMCIYIYITWHNMFTICNMDIVCIYIYISCWIMRSNCPHYPYCQPFSNSRGNPSDIGFILPQTSLTQWKISINVCVYGGFCFSVFANQPCLIARKPEVPYGQHVFWLDLKVWGILHFWTSPHTLYSRWFGKMALAQPGKFHCYKLPFWGLSKSTCT